MGSRIATVEQYMLELFVKTLHDVYVLLTPFTNSDRVKSELERDIRYAKARFTKEGVGFLTKQIPKFGKWFDRCFEEPSFDPPDGFAPFEGWRPRFLRDVVWHSLGLCYLDESASIAQAHLIRGVRTLFYLFYKLELPYDTDEEQAVLDRFREVDASLEDNFLDNALIEHVRTVMEEIVGDFSLDGEIPNTIRDDFLPHHGPGAVATGEKGDEKWWFHHHYESLHRVFPYYEFMYGIRSTSNDTYRDDHGNVIYPHIYWRLRYNEYSSMERLKTPTAKVVLVPKDSRGPRLISCEPLEVQWVQQGVSRLLVPHIERTSRGHINFADQTVNGNLALDNSLSREFATLDLQDASDRVSLALVKAVWPEKTLRHMLACRSHHTLLPNGDKIELQKYAPMGSALCFPVESVIFYSIVVAALRVEGLSWSSAYASCYVYGDDIIVPSRHADAAIGALTSFGLRVNRNKSFSQGSFRESCGVDAYHGKNVTPLKIKKLPPSCIQEGTSALAWASYASTAFSLNLQSLALAIVERLETVYGFIPYVRGPQAFLSIISHDPTPLSEYPGLEWDANVQAPCARLWTIRPKYRDRTCEPLGRLLESLTQGPTEMPDLVVVRDATQTRKRKQTISLYSHPMGHVTP